MSLVEITQAGLVISLLLFVVARLFVLEGKVREMLKTHSDKISELVEKERSESILAHRRINVHDSIASDITEKPVDTRAVAEGKLERPRVHGKIRAFTLDSTGNKI